MTSLPDTVAIIGLGLMGGSLARDLAAAGVRVLARDSRPEVTREALASGILADSLDESFANAIDADLVVIATPVDQAIDALTTLSTILSGSDRRTLVTDMGSTKAGIIAHANRIGISDRFVGAHPIAGDHRSGWAAARIGLFRDAPVYLCAGATTPPEAIDRVAAFWGAVGGECTVVDAAEHDTLMAWVSHLPQLAASAVAGVLAAEGHSPDRLGQGGRDVTRLAASSPEMWTAISLSNAETIAAAVGALRQRLQSIETAIRERDRDAVLAFFDAGKRWRSS